MMQGNRFPLSFAAAQSNVSLSTDVSGVPAITIGPNNQVYFAAAMKGVTFGSFGPPGTITTITPDESQYLYNIVVGNYASDGTPSNIAINEGRGSDYSLFNSANLQDSSPARSTFTTSYQLQGTTDDSSPSIAVGPDLEMYIAYVTQSQIPQRTNMSNVPSFCGCLNQGSSDIVVARLTNQYRKLEGNPPRSVPVYDTLTTADWRLQDATINSCSDETGPKLAIDRTNRFLYMVHQTNYQVLCFPVTGTDPNIILSCINLTTGAIVWREAQGGVNGSNQTRNPAIAVDTRGGICVAAEITGPMTGGRPLGGATVGVDVVKFQQVTTTPGVYGSRTRAWVLSQFVNLNPTVPGHSNTQPTIACDPVSGAILFAFVTTGTLPGQTRSVAAGATDLVVVTMNGNGSGIRVQQGGVFNPLTRPYQNATTPYATADPYGNFYLSVNVVELAAPYIQNVMLFKILKSGNTTWSYNDGPLKADAYAMAGVPFPDLSGSAPLPGDAPNSIFPAEANQSGIPVPAVYSQTPIAAGAGFFCTATVTNNVQDVTPDDAGFLGSNGLAVGFFNQALYYLNQSAYEYMAVSKSICACGINNCGC